jgi:UDP-N-acetylglucosamine transferase subunit ALG13
MGAFVQAEGSSFLGSSFVIFVTVGTQLAFDRLITSVDEWAGKNTSESIFLQIGPGQYKPLHCEFADFVAPDKANDLFRNADLIIAHAGMGSILTALKYKKPILVMPRKASLGEHRNEHQLATAKWLGKKPGIFVANEASEIAALLDARVNLKSGDGINEFADEVFTGRLKNFIDCT